MSQGVSTTANSAHVPIAEALGAWCAALEWGDIPPAVQATVPLRILDHVGLLFAGAATDAGHIALAYAKATGGAPEAILVGERIRLPAAAVALAHGTLAHCRDFDDTFMDSVVHPGSVVVAATLAVAMQIDASADDFAAGVVAGYEVAARIGAVAGRRFHARGMHATGLVGPIAAAAACARVRRLSAPQTTGAMGLAASMSSGLMAFMADGGWSKWLHAGWAAHGGCVAAGLAAQGFRGPAHVLDGGADLYSAMLHGETLDRSIITAGLGTQWRGVEAQYKYYPCAHVIQPYLDALLAVVNERNLRPADVRSVCCVIAPWAAAIVCEPRADKLRLESELDAIASLPYQLAHALTERCVGLDALSPAVRERVDLRALAQRIVHRTDPALGRGFDGAIEIELAANGERIVRATHSASADATRLCGKFELLGAPALGRQGAVAAARLLAHSHDWRTVTDILEGA